MDVSPLTANVAASTNQGAARKGASSLGSETFLQLLITQMKNQDPTAPMDSTDYMAQLAQFSQVEQQTKTNDKLDSLLTSVALAQADQFVGRTLTSADGATSGVVQSVRLTADGLTARLADGGEIAITPGITVA